LARFHADAPVELRRDGAELVKRALDDTFATLRSQAAAAQRPRLAAHEAMAAALLTSRWEQLDARGAGGCIRDGHGDLRLEHIVLDGDGLSIVDCVEFAPGLRRIDVAADLAFPVMELHRIGRRELADVLVSAYRDADGDPGDDRLLALLAAYRAHVRAKVAFTRAGQRHTDAHDEADALLRLAARLLWRALTPSVIVVAGLSASGKSTVARLLAAESGFPLLGTDALRKSGAGLASTARAPESLYRDEVSHATYGALGRQARAAARGGVIVDGTFRRRSDRASFFAGLGDDVTPLFVECRAPAPVLLARAEARQRDPQRISDAGRAVVAAQIGAFDPLDEIAAPDHVILRSDRAPGEIVSQIGEAAARRAIASPAR
jgi:predicted kinase